MQFNSGSQYLQKEYLNYRLQDWSLSVCISKKIKIKY